MKNLQKGFTIIELLVVIAIIAVLAAIVLVNVTQYINKGKDAAIKGNLATALTDSAVHFDSNGAYNSPDFCASSQWTNISTAITNAGGTTVTCKSSATQWCACSQEKGTTTTSYCVDSTGTVKETASSACNTDTCKAGSIVCS